MTDADTIPLLKENPEIGEILTVLDRQWKAFSSETDYHLRRGRASVLAALLHQLIEEPEHLLHDLQPGVLPNEECWFHPESFQEGEIRFLEETPFERIGRKGDQFFFYTDTGFFSPLYEGEPIDPYYVPVLRSHGPYVYTYEKRHVTVQKTVNHVLSAEVISEYFQKKKLPPPDPDAGEIHTVFCDPGGCDEKRIYYGYAVAHTRSPEKAAASADRISSRLGIRLLVAANRFAFCTR